MRADVDTARRAEWLACEMQDEREKVKHSIKYAVHLHEGGGELNDMKGTCCSEDARRSSVCEKCGKRTCKNI